MKKNLLGILFLFWVCMAWAGELKLWYSKPAKGLDGGFARG